MLSNCNLQSDLAENSIMQTITIAVSAILVAAGLVTAPGLINNARDNNATTDLANIAYAEEMFMGTTGQYSSAVTQSQADSSGFWLGKQEGLKYHLSGKVSNQKALVCNDPNWHYLAKATSASGKTFFRVSGTSTTSTDVTKLTVPSCITALPEYADFIKASATVDGSTPGTTTPPVTTPPVVIEPTTPAIPAMTFKTAPALGTKGLGSNVNIKIEVNSETPEDVELAVAKDSVLPKGTSLTGDTITGRFEKAGVQKFSIEATDAQQTVTQDFVVDVQTVGQAQSLAAPTAKTSYSSINFKFSTSQGIGTVRDVVEDSFGNIYYGKSGGIYKVPAGSTTPTLFVGSSTNASTGSVDGKGTSAAISNVRGMTADSLGNIYIIDSAGSNNDNTIRKITTDGYVSTIASAPGATYVNIGPDGQLYTNGNFLASNSFIQKINPDGTVERVVGSSTATATTGDRLNIKLNGVENFDWDSSGNMFIMNRGDNNIVKVNTAGNATIFVAATPGYDMNIDSKDNLIAFQTGKIIKISPTGVVSTIAGNGTNGTSSTLLASSIYGTTYLGFSADGSILVPSSFSNNVKAVQ
jgi:hypothetical protein